MNFWPHARHTGVPNDPAKIPPGRKPFVTLTRPPLSPLARSPHPTPTQILLEQKLSNHSTLTRNLQEKKALLANVRKTHSHCNKREVNIDHEGKSIASLEVEIMMAKDLPKMDWYSGKCDPYVILSLSPPAACLDTSDKRTKVKPRERSPVWNQSFIFKPIEFKKADLVLNVMDAENFGNDDFMGKIIIPLPTIENQLWVEKWYPLTDPDKKTEAKVRRPKCARRG